jgi:hypothetical protein
MQDVKFALLYNLLLSRLVEFMNYLWRQIYYIFISTINVYFNGLFHSIHV